MNDPGRGAPVAKILFLDGYRYKRDTELMVATEGMYPGQFIYCDAICSVLAAANLVYGHYDRKRRAYWKILVFLILY